MRVNSSFLRAVATTGTLAVLVAAGVMCQKYESKKSGYLQAAVAEQAKAPDTTMTTGSGATTDTLFNKTGTAPEYYTCSMHPQVHQAKPGKCPICGMNLEFHKADIATK